jgi:excisionase family DNA binding protein
MDRPERAPNIVPRGGVRLSEAFEIFYRSITPNWRDISDRCEQWDEQSCHLQPDDLGEDPYPIAVVATDRAENLFRWALIEGDLRAYIHNTRTGVDLELNRQGWRKSGEQVGINSDYSDSQMPGSESAVNGVLQPIFLFRTEFEQWLSKTLEGASATQPGEVKSQHTDRSPVLATRAFSVEDVMERIGLSKTKLYEEIDQGNLRARKSGTRTLILEPDLDAFLNGLQRA